MIKPRPKANAVRMLPSATTVLAICLGMSSVKFALEGRPTEAMALLAAAAILDALDGRVARVLNATSRMGEEIDSLADAVNFGVAPAFIIWATLLHNNRVGWIVVLLYTVCIVLRLARFNLGAGHRHAGLRQGLLRRDAGAGRRHRRDRPTCRQDAVARAVVEHRGRRDRRHPLDGGRLAAGGQPHSDAKDPHLRGFSEHDGPAAGAVRRCGCGRVRVPPSTILAIIAAYVIHMPFAVRSQRWAAAHPESWDDTSRQRRAARRATRRAQQPNRPSTARLRLRQPGDDT